MALPATHPDTNQAQINKAVILFIVPPSRIGEVALPAKCSSLRDKKNSVAHALQCPAPSYMPWIQAARTIQTAAGINTPLAVR
jgi:hypothetical protein